MKTIPFDIEITEPMSYFNVKTHANYEVEITCLSASYEFVFKFKDFQGLECREEFFDSIKPYKLEHQYLLDKHFNFPISYVLYEDFKQYLSCNEEIHCNESTKFWIFLSLTNYVELYVNGEPEIEVVYRKDKKSL